MWVVISLASLIVFITAILCVPLDLSFRVDVYGKIESRVRFGWLFGLITKDISRKRIKKKKPEIRDKQKPGKRPGGRTILTILQTLKTKGLLRQLRILIRDTFHRIKIEDFVLDCRVGLDDPADTAVLYGLIYPAFQLIDSPFTRNINLQPSFEGEPVFEGYSEGNIRAQPIMLFGPALRFAFSLPVIRVIKRLAWMKWKSKK